MRGCRFLEAELQDMDRILAGRKPLIRLGANMPARAERMARRSDFDQYSSGGANYPSHGEMYEVVLYFGVIDILQDYDITKKIEHAYKSWMIRSGLSLSRYLILIIFAAAMDDQEADDENYCFEDAEFN
ncbi:unnamed protein product, partial [Arabidopsis halleri]